MTPFEAYLQVDLNIQPMVNDRVTGLLETLFPRIPKEDWWKRSAPEMEIWQSRTLVEYNKMKYGIMESFCMHHKSIVEKA